MCGLVCLALVLQASKNHLPQKPLRDTFDTAHAAVCRGIQLLGLKDVRLQSLIALLKNLARRARKRRKRCQQVCPREDWGGQEPRRRQAVATKHSLPFELGRLGQMVVVLNMAHY
jgi:hypothetical protein